MTFQTLPNQTTHLPSRTGLLVSRQKKCGQNMSTKKPPITDEQAFTVQQVPQKSKIGTNQQQQQRPASSQEEESEDHGGPSVLAETVEKIALEVDYHGLADLYEASSWYAKLFWTVIVIGALCAVIHDCYNIILLFSTNPSATKISEFQVPELELPNVTVCNMGGFNQTELRNRLTEAGEPDLKAQNEFIRYMMIMAYQKPPGNNTMWSNVTLPSRPLWDKMIKNINETIEFLQDTAYQCPGFLSDCQYAEEPFDCCANDIFVYTDLGGCYTIRANNNTGPIYQTGRDSMSGISVTTEMDITEIAILEEWKSVGLRLQFGDYVSPFDFSSMLHLPPGMLALVRLSPVRYVLDSSVTDCWTDPPKLIYHDGYSTGLCKHDCVLKYTVKVCKCMPYGYSTKHAEQWPICTIEEMRTCVLPQVWNRDDGQDPHEVQQCKRSKCLRMCVYWIHEPYLMLSQLRADANGANPNKRTNVLNVYFGYMRYTQTEAAQLMTFDTFISNLGGAIGLWTGMSLISIVQILVYGWEGFWRFIERRRAEKMVQSMLAQHPVQMTHKAEPMREKPIQIKNSMFVQSVAFDGGGGGKFGKGPNYDQNRGKPLGPVSLRAGFVAKLKILFKRSTSTPTTKMFSRTDVGRMEESPPDPKPRGPIPSGTVSIGSSMDNESTGDIGGGGDTRNQSFHTISFGESPPATIADTGSSPPWMTNLDSDDVKKNDSKKKSTTNKNSGGRRSSASSNESAAARSQASNNNRSRAQQNRQNQQQQQRRHSRGAVGGVSGGAQAHNNTGGQNGGRHVTTTRTRTQSDHRQKRHPMSRARY